QTLNPTSEVVDEFGKQYPNKVGPFDFRNHEHLALFLLLITVRCFLRDNCGGAVARVFIDEGVQRAGIGIQLPGFSPEFKDGLLCFANSASIQPLQFADFAAFGVNRTQLLLGKDSLSRGDRKMLEIYSRVVWNVQNIEKRVVNLNSWEKYHPE